MFPHPNMKQTLIWIKCTIYLTCLGFLVLLPTDKTSVYAQENEPIFSSPPAKPTEVKVGLYLISVNRISAPSEAFPEVDLEMFMDVQWHDERLAFDPKEVGVNRKVYEEHNAALELDRIWWPDIEIENKVHNRHIENVELIIFPDGTVEYFERFNVIVHADVDLHQFPFDAQIFEVDLESFSWDTRDVKFVQNQEKIGWNEEFSTPEWIITNIDTEILAEKEVRSPEMFDEFIYRIYAQRQFGFYIWRLLLPFLMLVVFSWIVLWINGPIVPRVRGAIFGLLTVVVFHRIIVGFLPRISYLTLTDYIIFIGYVYSCLVILIMVAAHRVEANGRPEMGQKIEHAARWLIPTTFVIAIYLIYLGFVG